MSEVKDLELPILERLQTDVAVLRAKVAGVSENVLETKDELGLVKRLMTWHLGLSSESKHAIEDLQKSVKDFRS